MCWTESLLSFLFGSVWTICWAPGVSSMFSALPVWISWDRCLLPCLLRLAKYLLSFPLDQLSVSCPGRSVQSSVFHVRSLELTHFLWFYCSTCLNQTRLICCTAGICPMFIDLLVWRSVWRFYFLFRVIVVVQYEEDERWKKDVAPLYIPILFANFYNGLFRYCFDVMIDSKYVNKLTILFHNRKIRECCLWQKFID